MTIKGLVDTVFAVWLFMGWAIAEFVAFAGVAFESSGLVVAGVLVFIAWAGTLFRISK